jgi:hypothetical protein
MEPILRGQVRLMRIGFSAELWREGSGDRQRWPNDDRNRHQDRTRTGSPTNRASDRRGM